MLTQTRRGEPAIRNTLQHFIELSTFGQKWFEDGAVDTVLEGGPDRVGHSGCGGPVRLGLVSGGFVQHSWRESTRKPSDMTLEWKHTSWIMATNRRTSLVSLRTAWRMATMRSARSVRGFVGRRSSAVALG